MYSPKVGTVVNCIDGRTQVPVILYMKNRFALDSIDLVTEPGANLLLAQNGDPSITQSILRRVRLSLERHGSTHLALVGHYDCAANPAPRHEQIHQICAGLHRFSVEFPNVYLVGLWVNERWNAVELNWRACLQTE